MGMTIIVLIVAWLAIDRLALGRRLGAAEKKLGALGLQIDELGTRPKRKTKASSNVQAAATPEEPPKAAEPAKGVAAEAVSAPVFASVSIGSETSPLILMFQSFMRRFVAWSRENWFYLIAGLSVALAGIFLVQYGVEQGILSPAVRIGAAAVLGLALIGAGEWLRRKGGDSEGDLFAYIPSILAGGGMVTLFATAWGAYRLYGFVGPEMTLLLLAGLGALTIGLGWFYGPVLSGIGIVGAMAAPFLIGGDSAVAYLLNYYFAVIVIAGLAIDALKRWAWLSALALVLGFVAVGLIYTAAPSEVHTLAFALICTIAAIAIPPFSLEPKHSGRTVVYFSDKSKTDTAIEFPTALAWATIAVTSLITLAIGQTGAVQFSLSLAGFTILFGIAIVWLHQAPALRDAVLLPVAMFFLLGIAETPLVELVPHDLPGIAWFGAEELQQRMLSYLGVAVLGSLAAAWRSLLVSEPERHYWSILAVSIAPVTALIIELGWSPSAYMGSSIWALYLAGLAVLMMALMQRYMRVDGEDKTRLSYALVSALTLIALALMVVLDDAALTLALAAMVLLCLALNRRFTLPLLVILAEIGTILVAGRLVVYPGVVWAFEADIWLMIAGFAGSLALLGAGWYQMRGLELKRTEGIVESAIWSLGAIFVSLLLGRWLDTLQSDAAHWGLGLFATVWLISAVNQFYRVRLGGGLVRVRRVLAVIYSVIGCLFVALIVGVFNPLVESSELVVGPVVVNSLLLAFGLPALVFGAAWRLLTENSLKFRRACLVIASVLGTLYIALAIRHFWRGPDIRLPGITGAELYTYTVAMMIVSGVLLFFALLRQSANLRRIALMTWGVTAAKVFLVDAAGLDGLTRVVSFLALGLVLAALAWLDRRFSGSGPQEDKQASADKEPAT